MWPETDVEDGFKEEEFDDMKTDIKGLKDDMVELKTLLNKIANGW